MHLVIYGIDHLFILLLYPVQKFDDRVCELHMEKLQLIDIQRLILLKLFMDQLSAELYLGQIRIIKKHRKYLQLADDLFGVIEQCRSVVIHCLRSLDIDYVLF